MGDAGSYRAGFPCASPLDNETEMDHTEDTEATEG